MRSGRSFFAVVFAVAILGGAGAALAQDQPRPAQLPATAPAPSGSTRPDKVQPAGGEEACKRRWQEYERSQACFAPFRTVSGMKPQAYAACGKELPDPSAECGPKPQ